MKNILKNAVLFLLTIVMMNSCEEKQLLASSDQEVELTMAISGLNDLGDSTWYEAWMEIQPDVNSSKRVYESLGKLEVDPSGRIDKKLIIEYGYAQTLKAVLITMETADTTDSPRKYKILSSTNKPLHANDWSFSLGNEHILNFDLQDVSASYILDTPTDTTDNLGVSGVWFVIKDTFGKVSQGLNLPVLPTGWSYEGILINDGDTLSLGKFTDPAGSDLAQLYGAGMASGYPFPGEDFIVDSDPPTGWVFPLDLSGMELQITLTPRIAPKSNPPFGTLTVLKGTIPASPDANKLYTLKNNTQSFPAGEMTIEIKLYE